MSRFAVAELGRRRSLDDVVDAGAAAADVLLRGLEPLEPGDRVEHRARCTGDALRMAQVHESWKATRSGSGLRSARGSTRSSETSTTFATPWSFRCEPQPAAFVTM